MMSFCDYYLLFIIILIPFFIGYIQIWNITNIGCFVIKSY